MDNPAVVAVTAFELFVLAAAVGAAAGALWILPRMDGGPVLLSDPQRRLWKLLGLSALLFTLLSAAELLLRSAAMSELPLAEAAAAVPTVLFKTHYGDLWLARMAALTLLWIAWGVARFKPAGRAAPTVALLALAAVSYSLSSAGHAGDDGLFTLINLANTLHIVGALLWGGGIIVSVLIVFPALLWIDTPVARELVAASSLRLSTLAGVALALVLIPGVYNAWLLVGSWQALWDTTYGQLLSAKLLLVAAMMGLGALNRYRYVPAAQEYGGRPAPATLVPLPRFVRIAGTLAAVRHFVRSLRLEAMLLIAVLALAAALSQQTPAVHAEHDDMAEHHHDHAEEE